MIGSTQVLVVKVEAHDGEKFTVCGGNAVVIFNGENTDDLRRAIEKVAAQDVIRVKHPYSTYEFNWQGDYKQLVCESPVL